MPFSAGWLIISEAGVNVDLFSAAGKEGVGVERSGVLDGNLLGTCVIVASAPPVIEVVLVGRGGAPPGIQLATMVIVTRAAIEAIMTQLYFLALFILTDAVKN